MNRYSLLAWLAMALFSAAVQANSQPNQASQRGNADVVVDMPAETWTQGQNRQLNCMKCCIFDNRYYTEGAAVKAEGVLLQCARDEQAYGTNTLIWKRVK